MERAVERLEAARRESVALINDLEAEARAIAESTAESPDDEHDAEGSTVGYERARVAALLDRARESLGEQDEALRRVRDGTYGVCESCGRPIGDERLEALPTVTRCVRCASSAATHRSARR